MKVLSQTILAVALLVIGGFFATSVSATTIRSASSYGPSSAFGSCENGVLSSCEAFNLTSQGSVTLDGLVNYNVYQFAFNQNGAGPQVLDVFDLGSLAPGQTFTLSSALLSAAILADAQIFSCGTGPTAVDSSFPVPNPVNGPCTPGAGPTGTVYSALISNGVVGGVASFTTTADFALTDLVLEVPTQPVATPEPASLTLLGTGLAILAGSKLRRRKRA